MCHIVQIHNFNLIVFNVYEYNSKAEHCIILDRIEERIVHWLTTFPNAYILLGVDFNITLDNMVYR